MFTTKKSTNSARGLETLIARNADIEGRVSFTGVLTIEGTLTGDIIASSGEDAVVRITAGGSVKGQVRAPDVIINGHVQGDVYASGQLVLASDAVIDGNVHYSLIEMQQGAQINGNMVHSEPSVATSPDSRDDQEAVLD